MRIKKLFLRICFILIVLLIFYYLDTHGYLTSSQKISVSPTPSIVTSASPSAILGEATDSLCHAIHIDVSDEQAYLPDPNCTPGSIDPAVTQENLFQTICKAGYTKTVRPPVSYTNKLKKQQIQDYGFTDTDMRHYEEDHFISLELGGSPDDPKNLWPEPHASWNEKDTVEGYLHDQVCSGAMTLQQVQEAITKNWYEVYKKIK